MSPKPTVCDPSLIDRFLAGVLDTDQQRDFESHLDRCDACCERLQSKTAAASQWGEVQSYLSDEHISTDADIGPVREISLDFLSPADDPRMLGRFGGYDIAGVVGQGGMGIVLKGFDHALNRYAAIKVLAPCYASSAAARKRFAREAQAAAAVVHDNVIAIHGVDQCDNLPFLVMPYVRGESLQRRIDRTGALSVAEILRIALQTAQGLAAAHSQGLVHRDVKPANILLPDGVERVILTDFGLARAADDASLTRSGVIAGTPQYMSPEQARGELIDARSDLFSLGSVMYTMCTGHAPFRAETPYGILHRISDEQPRPVRQLNGDIPAWLARIIDQLHAKNPDDRFESAEKVAARLQLGLAHVQSPGSTLPSELSEGGRSWVTSILVAVSLIVLLLAGFAALQNNRSDEAPRAQAGQSLTHDRSRDRDRMLEGDSATADPVVESTKPPPSLLHEVDSDPAHAWIDDADQAVEQVEAEAMRLAEEALTPFDADFLFSEEPDPSQEPEL